MSTLSHEHCRTLLAALESVEGRSDEDAARIVLEHLATCAACAEEERRLAHLLADYRRTTTSPMPAGMAERLLDRLCPGG